MPNALERNGSLQSTLSFNRRMQIGIKIAAADADG